MDNNQGYIKRKGKLSTVVVACIATLVIGGMAGFGGTQLAIGLKNNIEANLDDIDRENLPNIFDSETELEYGDIDSGSDNAERESLPNVSQKGNYSEEYDAAELFEKLSDTVVGIKFDLGELSEIAGSGVVISEDGFIITCAHVIEGAEKVVVVVDDYDDPSIKHEFEAKVYGSDYSTDLAVIKIERDAAFKYAEIGKSSKLSPGQTVVAIGNPMGLIKTITQGIVSGLQRDLGENTYMLPSIQTDAALNPGNSGCPLFDMYGNVVGIVNIKLVHTTTLDNLGFAISIDEALPVIEELVKYGSVRSRPMIGITAKEITPMNNYYYGVSIEAGLYVETIRPDTPAAESGLARGDVIIKIDGEDAATIADIQSSIKGKSVGDEITVTVIRYDNYGDSSELDFVIGLTTNVE